jgi:hypothetical protein
MSTQCETENNVTIDELEEMVKEAKRTSQVDKHYVDEKIEGHLFDYDIVFNRFLEDMSHLFKKGKENGWD